MLGVGWGNCAKKEERGSWTWTIVCLVIVDGGERGHRGDKC